ncbi:Nacht domain protein, partial [Colletotrichum asianum]
MKHSSIAYCKLFLWVFLTIEDIFSQTNDAEIRESLKHIPRKLAETFEHALQRIMSNGKTSIAQDIFNWTATVRQPLTLDQLQESLAVKVGQSHSEPERYPNNIARLTMWCENLVYVEETDETVRFSHHSIRKYLLRDSKTFRINRELWDHHIGEICLTPSLIPGVKTARVVTSVKKWFRGSDNGSIGYDPQMVPKVAVNSAITLDYPFLKYASSQWVFHTTGFRSGKTETWNLWKSMLRTELTTWMDLNWLSKDPVSTTEDWLPPEEQADPEFGRSHLLSWHKAILLGAFTEHQTLMDHAFSVLGQHRAQLSSTLLRAFMSANHITIGLYSPLLFTLEDSDIHALVVHIFSRYIASGGRPDVAKTTKAEICNFKPTERHVFGVDQD